MKKTILTFVFSLLLCTGMSTAAFAQELVVGGQPVGIKISTDGILVAGVSTVETAEGPSSPAADAGICEGDIITEISGKPVTTASDFLDAVSSLEGKSARVTVLRNGKSLSFDVKPARSAEDQWMLGVWLRDSISGIGTLTFWDPDSGTYGALGHSINSSERGSTVPVKSGNVTEADIVSIVPGQQGKPGELGGSADLGAVIGSVEKNDSTGIYGQLYAQLGGELLETGEICIGPATILSTVSGRQAKEYSVEINRIYNGGDGQHVMLTVTDPALRALTGGIVQGMSGSPIIQNGRLVGAVTHVFINDPTKGYGLSIQDMLRSAGIETAEKAA
ncbi:MAG: SpoIVB peptidase [Oscillospiraceae bacterium]|nr:SpoIVB peptidase [Oscillospiraceae bacterium]